MSKVTSYSISGVNPTTQEVETLLEVGYDNGNASMWGDAVDGIQIDLTNPVTNGNLVVGRDTSDDYYSQAGGTSNVVVDASGSATDVGSHIAKYSYENIMVGTEGNHIGPNDGLNSGSYRNNAIVGQYNNISSTFDHSCYGNIVVGSSNSIAGSSGFGATAVFGESNIVNTYGGFVSGYGNKLCATQPSDIGQNRGRYCTSVIGKYNVCSDNETDVFIILGQSNTAYVGGNIIGDNNTVRGGTNTKIFTAGNYNTYRYVSTNSVIGSSNTLGDAESSVIGNVDIKSVLGNNNTITSNALTVSEKTPTLGLNNYLTAGDYNTVSGSEIVVGHHNSATNMSFVFGNYNDVSCGSDSDPSDNTKIRLIGSVVGNNNIIANSNALVIGNDNNVNYGGYLAIGNSNTITSGSKAFGNDNTLINGSNAFGFSNLVNGGGSHLLIGESNTASSGGCILIGRGLKTGSGAGSPVILGKYNAEPINGGIVLLLGDGSGDGQRNTLLYSDYKHDTYFSNCVFATNLPDAPSTAGTYTLQCVVDGSGNKTYSWV